MPGYSIDASGQAAIAAPQPVQEDAVLYVGNLSTDVTKPILYQYFVPYGNVISTSIKTNHYTGEHRGFAFVNFAVKEDAKRAKDALNHLNILGKEIRICFKKDFRSIKPEANLYFNGLPPAVRGKQLEEECKPFG